MKEINFDVSSYDAAVIDAISDRVYSRVSNCYRTRLELVMDITATHANGNPLRLDDMLIGSDMDLLHDVYGIHRHLDRRTGKLGGFFVPRFSVP